MIGNQKIKFYSTSIAKEINSTNWSGSGSISSGSAILGTNGSYIETTYTGKGLKPCKYKKYVIEFVYNGVFNDSFKYENLLQLEERVNYDIKDEVNRDGLNIISISDYKLKTKNGHQVLTLKTEVLDERLKAGKCIIRNNSSSQITIYSVEVYRSKDVTGQAADPSEYITPEGGMGFDNDGTGLYYMVPVMTLAEWNASTKDTFNEAIITG